MKPSTAVAIPVTTRGIGFHVHRYHELCTQLFGNTMPCTIYQMYRISLLQLDIRLQFANKATRYPFDPSVDVTYSFPYLKEFNEFSVAQRNFTSLARAISSVGNFVNGVIPYQPYVPEMPERRTTHLNDGIDAEHDEIDTNEHSNDFRIVCDPYLVTLSNLEAVVKSLSNCDIPMHERIKFKQRNSIPGAKFDDSAVLTNPLEIMPENYDFQTASKDMIDFMTLLTMADVHKECSALIEPITFQAPGHLSILVSVHHPYRADFRLENRKLIYSHHSTMRAYQPMSDLDELDGCINLMNEYPNTIRTSNEKEWKRWAIRSEYLSTSVYNGNWVSAVESTINANNLYQEI